MQPVILDYLASKKIPAEDLVVVSPDVGGVARARGFAKKLSDAPLAIVDKRRQGHNVSEVNIMFSKIMSTLIIFYYDHWMNFIMKNRRVSPSIIGQDGMKI